MADSSVRQRGPGRPFRPGQSGNPSGRNGAFREMQAAAQAEGPASIERLVWLRDNARDERVQAMAATALLDRGFGKPAQAITGEGGGPVVIAAFDLAQVTEPERILARLAELERLEADDGADGQ